MFAEYPLSSKLECWEEASWNGHVGSIWAAILKGLSLDHNGIIVEIGPGFTDKVGLALARQRFAGTLYLVEPNDKARSWVVERYRELLISAEVIAVAAPLAAAGALLPGRVDGLVMNHLLDDLVLSAALPAHRREILFQHIRPGRTEGLAEIRQTWQRLFSASAALHDLEQQILGELEQIIEATDPRFFGASQYPSWFLLNHGLEAIDRLGARLLEQLARRLGKTPERLQDVLRARDQDPRRWLVLERYSAPEWRTHAT